MVYIKKYRCKLCGDEFTSRSDEDFVKCKCGKNKLKAGYSTTYKTKEGFGLNFEQMELIGEYAELHETFERFEEKTLKLIEECSSLAEELGWNVGTWTKKMENKSGDFTTHIEFEYDEPLDNKIEYNVYKFEFTTQFLSRYEDNIESELTQRLTSLRHILMAQKNNSIDMKSRSKDNHALAKLNDSIEDHVIYWGVEKEPSNYYDYIFEI